eukprot:Pgem_evm1s2247
MSNINITFTDSADDESFVDYNDNSASSCSYNASKASFVSLSNNHSVQTISPVSPTNDSEDLEESVMVAIPSPSDSPVPRSKRQRFSELVNRTSSSIRNFNLR